jgi:ABC-type Fe3+/spermidine/putrescine transport system ATPase subunit
VPSEIWKDPQSAFVAKLLGIGNVIEGEVVAVKKVKTTFGVFDLDCGHKTGSKLQLLITAGVDRGEEIKLTVEDVLLSRTSFRSRQGAGLSSI